jgi:cell division protein FtsI/penicillin-binding protein 2
VAETPASTWRTTLKRRLLVAVLLLAAWAVAIEVRLAYLQIVSHAELMEKAKRQQSRTIQALPKRGDILDREGHVMAYSVAADSIYAVPTDIKDPKAAVSALCGALRDCSAAERRALTQRLKGDRAFAYVRRKATPEQASRVAALDLDGIGFMKEDRRFYPNKELAANLLGYVGLDNEGLGGLELAYERLIKGQAGTILVQTDARHRPFSSLGRPPTSGATLELTLDQYLQHVAERELRLGVEENRAAGGSVVVMDPRTGEILALANWPTFNPNTFSDAPPRTRRNRAVQDLYEPGSTFKIVTASAAFEERVVEPDDPIDVRGGLIRLGKRVVEDTHDYGVLSFTDVMVKSSNVGAIRVGLRLGPERLGRYTSLFGFGRRTSASDFPGESSGIWNPGRLTEGALASLSMGYEIGVTPLQMVTAVSSIANGGELLTPRVVRAVIQDGRRTPVPHTVVRRTVTADTAALLTDIMEQVVIRGTGPAAAVPGFTVAGKTGTAQKVVDGRYSHSDYNASFVGFVPSRAPEFAVVVVIDSPHGKHGYFGGSVAAPIFRRIVEAGLRHRGVPPSRRGAQPSDADSGSTRVTPRQCQTCAGHATGRSGAWRAGRDQGDGTARRQGAHRGQRRCR